MPKILEECVKKVMRSGKDKSSAFAICTANLQKVGKLKKGTNKLAKRTPRSIQDLKDMSNEKA